MLIPSSALVRWAMLWLVSAVGVSIWPALTVHWLGVTTLFALAVVSDALLSARRVRLDLRRHVPGSAPLGVWITIRLRLTNQDRLRLSCELFDHYPSGCAVEELPRRLSVGARGWVELTYRLRAES